MPEQHSDLQKRFERLPEGEPPLGLDTRIKAEAKAHLHVRFKAVGDRKRWTAAIATLGCAALAFVIAKPLLQSPELLSPQPALERQMDAPSMDSELVLEAAPVQMAEETELQMTQPESSLKSGGGASPANAAQSSMRDMLQPAMKLRPAAEPAMELMEESPDLRSAKTLADESKPPLQTLLDQLSQLQAEADSDSAEDVKALIEKLYPEHRFE